jgi:dCTP deaminase
MGKDKLIELVEKYKIIHPFNEKFLDGDSYILTVKSDVTLKYLEHKNLISNEVVFTPPDYIAYLTAKSRYGRMGLSFLNAAKVHSGWVGRLALEVVNLSNDRSPIIIMRGEPFMHVEFISREGKPSPYSGPYMFQYMSDEEVREYMSILKKFKGIFHESWLKKVAKNRIKG